MIRHVVTFKLKTEHPREEAAAQLRAALEPLAATIPGVRSLEIGVDDQSVPGHWDAVLISVHDSKEALAEYQIHPDHQAALKVVGQLVADKSVVDFQLASGGA